MNSTGFIRVSGLAERRVRNSEIRKGFWMLLGQLLQKLLEKCKNSTGFIRYSATPFASSQNIDFTKDFQGFSRSRYAPLKTLFS